MSLAEISLMISIGGVIATVLGLTIEHFKTISAMSQRLSVLETRTESISDIRDKVTALETKTELFWKSVEKHVVNMIASPHTHKLDALLKKFGSNELTDPETVTLKKLLGKELEASKGKDPGKALAIILMMSRLEVS